MDELHEGKSNARENVGVTSDNSSDVESSSCAGTEASR